MSIKVEHLTYIYSPGLPNETKALDDVSFEINDGEFVSVIGHTGSGKSTMLQHLNGLLRPTEGKIFVDGACITAPGAKMVDIRKKVGLVFQYPEYQLFEETVAKDVAFGPGNLGIAGEELDRVVRESIEIVGLDYQKIRDRSPFELSGGQKRRVAIAGVIAMNPKVLILDEPTAGLDPAAHREVLELLQRIHREKNIIIILVSHNMADVAKIADRVLVMDRGKLVRNGTPGEVFGEMDYLKSIGLDVPPVREIMGKLHSRIPAVSDTALTPEEAEREIIRWLEER